MPKQVEKRTPPRKAAPNENMRSKNASWLLRPQKRLGQSGLMFFIILASTIIPFSIDMYTPAVPSLPSYFNTTEPMVNFTLMGFFLVMTLASLIFGAVSDRVGRKPLLVGSLVVYTAGGIMCALATSIGMLIVSRLVQALGAGALMAVNMALVKDCFVEDRRERMIAIIQVLSVVGPVIAPLIGGFLLNFFDWRASFVALAVFGACCLTLAVLFEESLPPDERSTGKVASVLNGLVKVGKNRAFMTLLLMVSLYNAAFSAYLAVASYVYVDFFGTTPQGYTYFFAVTAAFTALGPVIWLKASKKVTPRAFTHVMIALGFASAFALLGFGTTSVYAFCIALILFATIQSAIRPYTTNVLLSQQKNDTGAASSLINFVMSMFGVIGMSAIMFGWPNYIFGIGAIMLICACCSCALWILLLRCPSLHINEFEK